MRHTLLRPTPTPPTVQLAFFVSNSSTVRFLIDLVVCEIDDQPVSVRLPYTLRAGFGERWRDELDRGERFLLRVARIGLCGRFDEGSLPELDAFAKGHLSSAPDELCVSVLV